MNNFVSILNMLEQPFRCLQGPETYSNMWQKTRSILSYMHDNYLDEFEYFYLAGDDTHLIVENLRNYLGLLEEQKGMNSTLFVGQLFLTPKTFLTPKMEHRNYFVSGGGKGYWQFFSS